MKRLCNLFVTILLAIIVFMGCNNSASSQTSTPPAKTNLSAVINSAQNGDVIELGNYVVNENDSYIINKSITLKNGDLKNASITVNAAGVVLENLSNLKNVTVASSVGNGDFTMINCQNVSDFDVKGGGENSVKIKNSIINNLTANKDNVRIELSDNAQVEKTYVLQNCIFDVPSNSTGVFNVVVVGTYVSEISLKGNTFINQFVSGGGAVSLTINIQVTITINAADTKIKNSIDGDTSGIGDTTISSEDVAFVNYFKNGDYAVIGEPADATIKGGTYVTFGTWPQTEKEDNIFINKTKTMRNGIFTYYLGSDSEWYAEMEETTWEEIILPNGDYDWKEKTERVYRKVEPIVWRIIDSNKGFLLAEKALRAVEITYYPYPNVYRNINGKIIYPNNYKESRIRAFLNGTSYAEKASEFDSQTTNNEFYNNGFLQTAFTEKQIQKIKTTRVDNSARSIQDNAMRLDTADIYTCEDTYDKVFLLSEQEITNPAYGFTACDDMNLSRRRSFAAGLFEDWWLRSPMYNSPNEVRLVFSMGDASDSRSTNMPWPHVVPALCVEK